MVESICCGLLYFRQSVEWSSDVAWWTCRAIQSLEWIRSHHEGLHRKIERRPSTTLQQMWGSTVVVVFSQI